MKVMKARLACLMIGAILVSSLAGLNAAIAQDINYSTPLDHSFARLVKLRDCSRRSCLQDCANIDCADFCFLACSDGCAAKFHNAVRACQASCRSCNRP
jgi:hypothetical protein